MKQHFGLEDERSDASGRLVEGTCGQGLGGDGRDRGSRPDLRGPSLALSRTPRSFFELFHKQTPSGGRLGHCFQTLPLQSFV